uniref:RecF/RecN/SMC N-terminal domain-containing protein n=1 Tax=Romanomermis culicivorax TaxID=13658 RepID=A0A915KH72_ROMCU
MEVDKRPAKSKRRNAPVDVPETETVESAQANMDDRATGSEDFMAPFLEADRIESLEIPVLPEPLMNFDGSGPRLLITHIVNENFKSYAGRHAIGPFHKNFTAIVGPNGSGKSNVIDSLLFVFGYRAQKIRSKKISVLIHNSENHPDITSCTVEIHFVKAIDKNDHEYDVIDGSKFFVSRTAYKNGSSEYSLNGRKVPFKDIGALLRGSGIDLDHNRFLILQGEVEQIALMKPKALQEGEDGMLEYLEDIIGSSRLVPYIDSLNKKCEELNEVRTEKVNRVKVVEAEKLELEETKNVAVEYLLLENEIIRKKNLLYHLYMLKADDNCKEMDVSLEILRKEYAEQEQNIKEMEKDIHSKKEKYVHAKKAFDQCSSEAEKHQNSFAEMDKEDTKAREDLKHCFNKIKKLNAQLEADTKKLDDLKAAPKKAEAEIAKLNARMAELEESIPQLENKFAEGTDIQSKKEEAETALAEFQKRVNDARSKVDIAQSELDICTSAQKRESDKLNELNTKLSSLIESRSTKK